MEGNVLEMGFEGEFDAVFSNAALHWISCAEQGRALRRVWAALRPGGLCAAAVGCGEERMKLQVPAAIPCCCWRAMLPPRLRRLSGGCLSFSEHSWSTLGALLKQNHGVDKVRPPYCNSSADVVFGISTSRS